MFLCWGPQWGNTNKSLVFIGFMTLRWRVRGVVHIWRHHPSSPSNLSLGAHHFVYLTSMSHTFIGICMMNIIWHSDEHECIYQKVPLSHSRVPLSQSFCQTYYSFADCQTLRLNFGSTLDAVRALAIGQDLLYGSLRSGWILGNLMGIHTVHFWGHTSKFRWSNGQMRGL